MSELNRSHPPALRRTIKKTLLECKLPPGSKILLGVSGGMDSMALMHVLHSLQQELNFTLYCCGVNHNLRPEAQTELDIAKGFADALCVPFIFKSVHIDAKSNIQERARILRYQALNQVKELVQADYVCTAHHTEDRAETVLMRIIHGTSIKGLKVMQALNGTLLRPMIKARKRDVELHVQRKSIPYSDDPSNLKVDVYTRSKIRYQVMPELQKMNPNIVDALCELSNSAMFPEVTGKRMQRKAIYENIKWPLSPGDDYYGEPKLK